MPTSAPNLVDRFIGWFSPAAGLRRAMVRRRLEAFVAAPDQPPRVARRRQLRGGVVLRSGEQSAGDGALAAGVLIRSSAAAASASDSLAPRHAGRTAPVPVDRAEDIPSEAFPDERVAPFLRNGRMPIHE